MEDFVVSAPGNLDRLKKCYRVNFLREWGELETIDDWLQPSGGQPGVFTNARQRNMCVERFFFGRES